MNYYGHFQMRNVPNFLSRVRHLKLPNKRLNNVNLKNFSSLEVLDLSGNNFKTIDFDKLVR